MWKHVVSRVLSEATKFWDISYESLYVSDTNIESPIWINQIQRKLLGPLQTYGPTPQLIPPFAGLGYCFSASLPPLLATAASEGIKMIDEEPGRLERLQRFAKEAHEKLDKALQNTKFAVRAAEVSPMKHIVCEDEDRGSGESKLDSLVNTVSWKWEEGDEWLNGIAAIRKAQSHADASPIHR